MKRFSLVLFLALALACFIALPVWSGSPHFVTCSQSINGNTMTVDGKETGLGNEAQVHIEVTAMAACINPGSKHPTAANKESLTAGDDFPIQNGQALFSLQLTSTFQPSCSPPMSVEFSDMTVTDTTHGISCTLD